MAAPDHPAPRREGEETADSRPRQMPGHEHYPHASKEGAVALDSREAKRGHGRRNWNEKGKGAEEGGEGQVGRRQGGESPESVADVAAWLAKLRLPPRDLARYQVWCVRASAHFCVGVYAFPVTVDFVLGRRSLFETIGSMANISKA